MGATYSIEPAYLSELFATNVRYTGVSIGAQLVGIVGGLTPAVATGLTAWAGGASWPISLLVIVTALVTGLCTLLAGETRHRDIDRDAAFG